MSGLDLSLTKFEDDKLGFDSFSAGVAEFTKTESRLPFTLGIYGPWGSGKTTMMNSIQLHLQEETDIKSVWFDA